MATVDLNCDLGEGGADDERLMPLISSANIACGIHAGDALTIRAAIELAQRHGVAVGAHPSLDDRENFGRREMPVSPEEVRLLVLTQVRLFQKIAELSGVRVRHVKPHGALYNMAARDGRLATAVVRAVREVDPGLILFGLAGGRLVEVGRAAGLTVAREAFADRTYQADGSLTARAQAGALIHDAEVAVAQVRRMVREGVVTATDGTVLPIQADTICLHGDGPDPVEFARRLHRGLRAAGIEIKTFGP